MTLLLVTQSPYIWEQSLETQRTLTVRDNLLQEGLPLTKTLL